MIKKKIIKLFQKKHLHLYIIINFLIIVNFFELYNKSKNNMKISISYITNFKPSDFLFFSDFKLFKKTINNKIVSRNFFLFLLLLKYSDKNFSVNTSIFVKPNYNKFITLLRAPYRNKLSRHQFKVSRYFVLLTIKSDFEKLYFLSQEDLILFIKLIKNFYIWFESNIVYQHQVKVFFFFFYIKIIF